MKCLLCGKELPENAKFCDSCGARVVKENPTGGVMEKNGGVENSVLTETIGSQYGSVPVTDLNMPQVKPMSADNINSQNLANANVDMTKSLKDDNKNRINKTNKKLPIIIVCVLVALILGALACFIFLNKKSAPKSIFVDGFNNVTKKLFQENNDYKSVSSSLKFNANIPSLSTNGITDLINGLSFDSTFDLDADAKMFDGSIKVNYQNQEALNIGAYSANDEVYMYLIGLYDKYVKLPLTKEEYANLYKTESIDMATIKSGIDKAFADSIKDSYLTKSSKKIAINGKETKVTVNTLNLDEKTLSSFGIDFINSLKNNEKFLKVIGDATKKSVDELKSSFSVDNSTVEFDDSYKMKVSIYTQGFNNKFRGIEFTIIEDKVETSFVITKVDNSNYELSVTANGQTLSGNMKIQSNDNSTKFDFTMNLGIGTIGFTLDNKYSKNVKINKKDVTNAVSLEQFEANGALDIYNNMVNNKVLSKLINDVMNLIDSDTFSASSKSSLNSDQNNNGLNDDYSSLLGDYDFGDL